MKILSIGDIHGTQIWKKYTHGGIEKYHIWKTNNREISYPFKEYDKIVFIGDYVDSIFYTSEEILNNLLDIIAFKVAYPNKVILLMGNHDYGYIDSRMSCTGYRTDMDTVLRNLFTKNKDLFQVAYQAKNHLWTHAGCSSVWINNLEKKHTDENYIFKGAFEDFYENGKIITSQIANLLNKMYKISRNEDFFQCFNSKNPVTDKNVSSFLWIRPSEINYLLLPNITQIVGHTASKNIIIHKDKTKNAEIVYIDTLNGDNSKTIYEKEI